MRLTRNQLSERSVWFLLNSMLNMFTWLQECLQLSCLYTHQQVPTLGNKLSKEGIKDKYENKRENQNDSLQNCPYPNEL